MAEQGYNAALDFVDRHLDEGREAKLAYIDDGRTLTYGQLAERVRKMGGLLAAHGVRPEERVAVLMHDTVDFPVVFWGCIRAGVIPVALNTLLGNEPYAFILANCRARALFVSAPLFKLVEPLLAGLPRLEHVFVVGGPDDDFEAQLSGAAPAPPAETVADDAAFWLYSSGSTGTPKGVVHAQGSLRETFETYGRSVVGIRESDVVYSAAKLFFAYGLGNGMTFPLAVGATTILLGGRPTPQAVFDILRTRRPTLFFGVPTLYAGLLAEEGAEVSSALRLCVSAGEALPEDLGRRWRERFGVEILDGVGSTEMLHIFLSNRPAGVVYGTSGEAVPGYDLRLVDEAGREVEDGEVGELLVSGRSAALGYWNLRDRTRATFQGEWTRTGDKYVRAGARYTYCGRTDDMFKVGGIWVSPFEVESALVAHKAVLECAVVPFEDGEGLTKPRAFVVLHAPEEANEPQLRSELKVFVQEAIGKWKYPREIVFSEALPKTATGKVQRFKLRS